MGVNPFANHFRPTDIEGDGGKGQGREMEGGRGGGSSGNIIYNPIINSSWSLSILLSFSHNDDTVVL